MIIKFTNGCTYNTNDKEHYSTDNEGGEWEIIKLHLGYYGLRGYGMGTERIKLEIKEIIKEEK